MPLPSDVLSDIEARGKETDQGRQNVADLIQGRANQMNVLSDIKDIGKEKEEGIKNVSFYRFVLTFIHAMCLRGNVGFGSLSMVLRSLNFFACSMISFLYIIVLLSN